jgi:hypothetical protein
MVTPPKTYTTYIFGCITKYTQPNMYVAYMFQVASRSADSITSVSADRYFEEY